MLGDHTLASAVPLRADEVTPQPIDVLHVHSANLMDRHRNGWSGGYGREEMGNLRWKMWVGRIEMVESKQNKGGDKCLFSADVSNSVTNLMRNIFILSMKIKN